MAGESAADRNLSVFRPGEIWPDNHGQCINAHGGGILQHEGTYYWFGEHKIAGESGNKAQIGVHVYSSKDLYNWTDQGIALAVAPDPASDIAAGCILERPKVLFNEHTGKFVLWFHLELKNNGYGSARSGVAVADRPTGPYRYLYSLRPNAGVWPDNLPPDQRQPLNAREQAELARYHFNGSPPDPLPFPSNLLCRRDFAEGQMARDMTLFLDDNGKAWQIYASEENGTLHISQLDADYLKPAGHYGRVLIGGYNEAPALFKKDGKYYLLASGTTGWQPNACRSYSASSIFGPWTYLGNPCRGTEEQNKITFDSQPACVLPAPGHDAQFIFMADRWRPRNPIDSRYVWLPLRFDNGLPVLEWKENWNLDIFNTRVAKAGK
jgi:beta-xylosidase